LTSHSTVLTIWTGHILRHDDLLLTVLEQRVIGGNHHEKKNYMLDNLTGGKTYNEVKRLSEDRMRWKEDIGPAE